jgi:hypothetical protein
MNPRDLPEGVAELIIEMHEVRSEQKEARTESQGMREDLQAMPERMGTAAVRALEPFLNRLLEHDDQLRRHEGRLNNLESSQQ